MSPSDWGGTATDPMESTCFMNNNHNTGIQFSPVTSETIWVEGERHREREKERERRAHFV